MGRFAHLCDLEAIAVRTAGEPGTIGGAAVEPIRPIEPIAAIVVAFDPVTAIVILDAVAPVVIVPAGRETIIILTPGREAVAAATVFAIATEIARRPTAAIESAPGVARFRSITTIVTASASTAVAAPITTAIAVETPFAAPATAATARTGIRTRDLDVDVFALD